MEVGNIVEPTKESGFVLRSGAEQYKSAVIISLDPFVLVSGYADMRWESTVKQEYFTVVGSVGTAHLTELVKRL